MSATYTIDPAHSTAQFVVRHMMITNVRGGFNNIQGTVTWDAANPAATAIDVAIDASTINTHEEQRDNHLRSADFLDVEKFPSITFRSTGAQAAGDGEVSVAGQSDRPRSGEARYVESRRADRGRQGPVGKPAHRRLSHDEDQAQRVRTDVQRGARNRRHLVGDDLKIEIEVSLIKG